MSVAVETISQLERRVKIAIPAERIEQEINERLVKLSRTAKIDGFRVGKIPLTEVSKRFRASVQFEVLDNLMRKSLTEALQQEKINPAGISKLEPEGTYEAGKPFSYSALLEVYPEIKLKPFAQLEVEKAVATVGAEDIEKTIENMRKQQVTWQATESAAAEEGDRVTIDFAGTIDDVAFDGGTGKDMAVVIGSKNTIAGFEDGLKKTKVGQSVKLNLTFPENYHAKDLAGKPVVFAITVNKVEKPVLPELNDEFAVKFGVKEGGLAKLREEVTNTLNQQLQQQLRTRTKNQIMKNILAAYAEVEIPKALIHREAEHMAHEMQERFKQFGQQAKAPTFNLELFETQAKERVSLGLIINEIVKQHELKPNADKVRQLIEQFAQSYQDPEEVVRWYYRQKDRLAEMEYLALEEQVVDTVLAQAKVTEKTIPASEVFAQGETNV